MNIEEVKELIKEVSASQLVQLDLQEGNIKLSLKKEAAIVKESIQINEVEVASVTENAVEEVKTETPEVENLEEINIVTNSHVVKSPLVGTAHLTDEETGEPFVTVGTYVKKGQTLAVVEAMKMMNEIEAEVEGTIAEIRIEDGTTVEYNGEMFVICQKG